MASALQRGVNMGVGVARNGVHLGEHWEYVVRNGENGQLMQDSLLRKLIPITVP